MISITVVGNSLDLMNFGKLSNTLGFTTGLGVAESCTKRTSKTTVYIDMKNVQNVFKTGGWEV
jgi:hypothetical protein